MLHIPSPLEASPILLTHENFKASTHHLSRDVRRALKVGMMLKKGTLTAALPSGDVFQFQADDPEPRAEVIFKTEDFARRLLRGGVVGFSESYIAEEWESPDVAKFLELFCLNHRILMEQLSAHPITRLWLRLRHWMNANTKRGSRKNISAHYDLGNDFYKAWLDPSMTYSSAYFGAGATDLEGAQKAKYAALADQCGIKPGDRVLEIGCGWGGFAEYLAGERGAHVTALTISQEQFAYARERIEKAGLSDKVEIRFQDYRDETGTYDAIVSVEMFEAVGEQYWPVYFKTLERCLEPGGRVGLQIITIQDKMFDNYKRSTDFIQRHIFPGGMLPSPSILSQLADKHGLSLHNEHIFGVDYARTLAEWRDRFLQAWPHISLDGFDERFRRLWSYYFSYCEAGFRSGNIDVRQIVFQRAPVK